MIVGHQHIVKDFERLAKVGKLAQSYIFFGEPEVGKYYFAKHLANYLECGRFELSGRLLQDALFLDDAIGIEAMRELKKFFWIKPFISSKRLAIINNAENLTPEAQNAILKITEEPPPSAILILVARQLENLISPLVSRLQKIYFGRLADAEIGNFVNDKKIIISSLGRPGRAFRLQSDPLTQDAKKYACLFLKANGSERSRLIKGFIDIQKGRSDFLDMFFEELILELRKDIISNAAVLKSVLNRFFMIKSYNTNKRIQMEAI